MDVHGQADLLAQGRHQALGAVGREHAGHVLDADGVRAQLLEGLRVLDVAVERVHGAHGVRDGALEVGPALVEGLGGVEHVADVVQGVEDAEDVHAVAVRRLDEAVDDVFGVVVVAHEVLAAGEHGERRVGAMLLDDAQALPGVFVEEAQASVEGGASPALEGPVADLVHLLKDGKHVAGFHAGRPQGLVGVAQGRVHDAERLHRKHLPFYSEVSCESLCQPMSSLYIDL